MEIRGIGVVDVRELFGVWRVGLRKEINLVVQLVPWGEKEDIERTGLNSQSCDILGVKLPRVVIPISPGKNLTVISEVIAMNHILLNIEGVSAAQLMEEELMKKLLNKVELKETLKHQNKD
jgi:HPr kinase/phosphorylase